MNVLITCGPSYEPIDQVRRLTNFSTGQLGVKLAEALARHHHSVTCLKGIAAQHPDPIGTVVLERFTTNSDLELRLRRLATEQPWDALFHAAALCDYRVAGCVDEAGRERRDGKIPSAAGSLTLHLTPAPKLINRLRLWYPAATIVGWKFEVNGSRTEAIARGWRQIGENRIDACVVNGPACGTDFVVCLAPDTSHVCPDRETLIGYLTALLSEHNQASTS